MHLSFLHPPTSYIVDAFVGLIINYFIEKKLIVSSGENKDQLIPQDDAPPHIVGTH